jgi:pimeloyl-ACP methyl ester carboxylesterase
MILYSLMTLAAVLGALAAATAIGAIKIERDHPPTGRFVTVEGTKLHVLELGPPSGAAPSASAQEPAIVLIHGASGNVEDMRFALGERLAKRHRVILIDRPGHGWSERRIGDNQSSPQRQAELIDGALQQLGVLRAVLVAHSLGGAVAPALVLTHPQRVAGMVLLGPVTHPWPGGIAWYYNVAKLPVIGEFFAYTLAWPIGALAIDAGVRSVFAPQPAPEGYAERAAVRLVLRPKSFLANARDVAGLLEFVTSQVPRYPQIKVPTVIITGDRDGIVSPTIHSQAFARTLAHAKLILLPNVGHMPQYVAPEKVEAAIDEIIAQALLEKSPEAVKQ